MPKRDLLATINNRPPVRNGELVSAATVIQVSQLSMSAPYRGDFQIIDQGRLIVGEHPDLGERVVISSFGAFLYDPDGINTFAALSRQWGPWGAGDVFTGYASGNYLLFDQSAGTLGVYSPAGAGFIAAADGSLYAGDTDGAHMRWNTATRAIEVRNGADVKISLDANGDGFFDGTIYAAAGRIYGPMQVDGLLRAGDVDGPSVSLGRFSRINNDGDLVESAEIVATDASNMPWFRVVAGGGTQHGGWFHLGATGDYPQRLTYDGADLVFDGTLYARGGEFTGEVSVSGGGMITFGDGNRLDKNGLSFISSNFAAPSFSNSLTWLDVTDKQTIIARAFSYQKLAANYFVLTTGQSNSDGATDGVIRLEPLAGAGKATSIEMTAQNVSIGSSPAGLIGFYGASATAQQTLATGAGATPDEIITALQNLGLVKQA